MAAEAGKKYQDRVAKSAVLIFPEFLVEMKGFEPSTPALRKQDSAQ
jgi:hypothetical protein